MEFVYPFPGKSPGDEITEQELLSAVRLSLCAEEEATHLYDTVAEFVARDPNGSPGKEPREKVRKVMEDVASEEQVHIGEFQRLLKAFVSDESDLLEEGEAEVEEKMDKSEGWVKGNCKFAGTTPWPEAQSTGHLMRGVCERAMNFLQQALEHANRNDLDGASLLLDRAKTAIESAKRIRENGSPYHQKGTPPPVLGNP